nr:MAG TPA: hypothetical protein [Caudoviricetes sp.]
MTWKNRFALLGVAVSDVRRPWRLSKLLPQLAERSEAGTPTGDNTFCGLRFNQNLLFAAFYAIIKP